MNFKLIGSSTFLSICAVILSIQLGWVYSVNATDPLTSPITTPIYEPSPCDQEVYVDELNVSVTLDKKDAIDGIVYGDGFTLCAEQSTPWYLVYNESTQGQGFYETSGVINAQSTFDVPAYINVNKPVGTYSGSALLRYQIDGSYVDGQVVHYAIVLVDSTVTPTVTPTPTDVPVTPTPITEATPTPAEAKKEESKSSNSDTKQSFTCTAAKPNEPILISSTLSGKTKATIVWAKGIGAVTSYVIWYGTDAGYYQYATPKITGADILSYTVNDLASGKTYYFRVQPYNECMPGTYSKEGIVKTPSVGSNVQLGVFYPETSYSTSGAVVTHESTPVVEDKVLGDSYDYGDQSDESFMQWMWNSVTGFFSNLFS